MSEHGNDLRRFLSYEATSGQDQAGPKFRRDVFSGVLLFIDISGYSAMANNFACMGEVGVELLSNLLNGFLTSQVIDLARSRQLTSLSPPSCHEGPEAVGRTADPRTHRRPRR